MTAFAVVAFTVCLLVLAALLAAHFDEVKATASEVAGRISRAWTELLQLLYTPRVGGYRPRHIVRLGGRRAHSS